MPFSVRHGVVHPRRRSWHSVTHHITRPQQLALCHPPYHPAAAAARGTRVEPVNMVQHPQASAERTFSAQVRHGIIQPWRRHGRRARRRGRHRIARRQRRGLAAVRGRGAGVEAGLQLCRARVGAARERQQRGERLAALWRLCFDWDGAVGGEEDRGDGGGDGGRAEAGDGAEAAGGRALDGLQLAACGGDGGG